MDFLAALEKLTQGMNIFGSMNDSNIIAKHWNYVITSIRSYLIPTCHHTCKLYSIYMILEHIVVHHSMYNMCMSKNNHVNREPVSCLTYHILNIYDFDVFFGWPCVQGGCNWNMSNIFWEMFYNIICHIFDGGFISFWIIPLLYFKCYSDTFYPCPSIFLYKCILRPVRFHHFCSFFMGGVYV